VMRPRGKAERPEAGRLRRVGMRTAVQRSPGLPRFLHVALAFLVQIVVIPQTLPPIRMESGVGARAKHLAE
jgi:hypothetical protein